MIIIPGDSSSTNENQDDKENNNQKPDSTDGQKPDTSETDNKDKIQKLIDIQNHWAKEYVEHVVAKGILSGDAYNRFYPDMPMTRGMLVTALGRQVKVNVQEYKGK